MALAKHWACPVCMSSLAASWARPQRAERMSDDLWKMPVRDLMLNSAQERATHYRQQAAELRGMAKNQIDESVKRDLFDLAAKYDALANSVSTQ